MKSTERVIMIPNSLMVGLETVLSTVWSNLMEERHKIIGLYGISGVGKTAILKEINNKFLHNPNGFDVVIWITVSKHGGIEKIQHDIWTRLGFYDENWINKNFHQKAIDIFSALVKKKFCLLLDDVWERLDLIQIGIPHLGRQNGSTVLFTTHSELVCSQMQAQYWLNIQPLENNKAWDLFVKNVGDDFSSHQHLHPTARAIVDECVGVPFALLTVAHAMATKRTLSEWHSALLILKNSPSKFSGMRNMVFPILQSGYDFPSNKLKSCFFYCVFFPKKFKILKEDLIDCWICEEFLDAHENGAYMEGYHIIRTLIDAGLLQDQGKYVRMENFIREMALSMVRMHENVLVLANDRLREAPKAERWKGIRKLSLMKNSIHSLIEVPTCPELSTLFLSHNRRLTTIADGFFQSMEALTVLDLSNSSIQELPVGISKLVLLQYLNISRTWIEQLPLELKMLRKLKCLNLEHNDLLRVIPREVISNLLRLQVLKMFSCDISLIDADDNLLSYTNKHVQELEELKDLEALGITITCMSALRSLLNIPKLQSCIRALSLKCFWGLESFNISLLANMKHLEKLEICRNDHLKELTVNLKMEAAKIQEFVGLHGSITLRSISFNNFREVTVKKCPLRDLTWLVLAPNLTILKVIDCKEITEIVDVEKLGELVVADEDAEAFPKLEFLVLQQLPQLRSIYWEALPFSCLKEIKVFGCPMLKKLPLNSKTTKGSQLIIVGQEHWWKNVEWEDNATKIDFLPRCIRLYGD